MLPTPALNLQARRRLHMWKLIRREIHMKRTTLLTAVALGFSLFTVTAAIAGPGPGTGEGDHIGDTLRLQTHTRAQDGPCC